MCLTKDKDVKGRATIQSLVVVKDDSLFRECKQQKVSRMQPLCVHLYLYRQGWKDHLWQDKGMYRFFEVNMKSFII